MKKRFLHFFVITMKIPHFVILRRAILTALTKNPGQLKKFPALFTMTIFIQSNASSVYYLNRKPIKVISSRTFSFWR